MIHCCGEALIDFIPTREGLSYWPCPGGSLFNIAVGLGRMDVPVAQLTRLSKDIFCDLLEDYLVKNPVSLEFCSRVEGQTTMALLSLPEEDAQEPRFAFFAEGAVDRNLTISDLPKQFGDDDKAMHFGSIS